MKKQISYLFNVSGFTLVELLVAITILTILSLIGLTVYGNSQRSARDAKRVADVKAIGQAYETKYRENTGYQPITNADFSSGGIPTPPEGGAYAYVEGPGPHNDPDPSLNCNNTVKICTALENGSSAYCYTGLRNRGGCPSDPDALGMIPSLTPSPTYIASSSSPSPSSSASPSSSISPSPTGGGTPASPPPAGPGTTSSPTPSLGIYESRVFVTSARYTGNFGGVSAAHTICQNIADFKGLGGKWKAWISNSVSTGISQPTVSPFTEFNVNTDYRNNTRFILLSNHIIANNWNDLLDGGLNYPISINENVDSLEGAWGNERYVWSYTNIDGKALTDGDNCSNWTSSDHSLQGSVGHLYFNENPWTGIGITQNKQRCDDLGRLYCFEQSCSLSTGTPPTAYRLPGPVAHGPGGPTIGAAGVSYNIPCTTPAPSPTPTSTPSTGITIGPITIPLPSLPWP